MVETRYINPAAGEIVQRNSKGEIVRSSAVLSAFQKIHPCPSTNLTTGDCPHYSMNHVMPLACGGRDEVSNLIWIRFEFKTGYAILPKGADGKSRTAPLGYINENGVFVDMHKYATDRIERKISALNPPIPDTNACVNVLIP